ncbi:hypothetical protein ACFL5X_01125 [Candidatus Omnitrophota bacterium]
MVMIVTGWNNGQYRSSGAGYGIKIRSKDRNKYFDKKWKCVLLKLPGKVGFTRININKKSFWDSRCRELIKKDIGIWIRKKVETPWRKGNPPKMIMEKIDTNKFGVKLIK